MQDTLAITQEQTMVFGDFLNDLGMMDEAEDRDVEKPATGHLTTEACR